MGRGRRWRERWKKRRRKIYRLISLGFPFTCLGVPHVPPFLEER